MKEELLKYTCDNCGNTITVNAQSYTNTPLHHYWIRLYRLMKSSDLQKTKLHFCKDSCCVEFLLKEAE